MATACRIDELYRPVSTGATDRARGGLLADYAFVSDEEERVATGLRGAPTIIANPRALPKSVWDAVDRFKALESLSQGWDTYTAKPVDIRAVRPALNLVLQGLHFCMAPRITAASNGGLILLWESAECELELEVTPAGMVEAYYRDDVSGEEIEPEGPLSVAEALSMIKRLRSVHAE